MRGSDERPGPLFGYVDLEDRIPASHPLRKIRAIVNKPLSALAAEFAKFTRPMAGPRLRLSGFYGQGLAARVHGVYLAATMGWEATAAVGERAIGEDGVLADGRHRVRVRFRIRARRG